MSHPLHVPRARRRTPIRLIVIIAAALALVLPSAIPQHEAAFAAGPLISQGKPATASSVENAGTPAANAPSTATPARAGRSAFSRSAVAPGRPGRHRHRQPGGAATGRRRTPRRTRSRCPTNATTWTTIYSTTTGTGGTQTLTVTGTGRYVRMNGTARATGYGYSLWEFQVYGSTGGGTDPAVGGTPHLAVQAGGGAVLVEGGNAPGRRAGRQHQHPVVQRRSAIRSGSRSTSAPPRTISQVVLNWEAAYATGYQIQTSDDGTTWTTIYTTTTGTGGIETLNVSGTGRYVRMYGTARATGYGYSLWEFQVYGTGRHLRRDAADAVRSDQAPRRPLASSRCPPRPTARWSRTPAGRRCPGPRSAARCATRSGSTSAGPTTTSPRPATCLDLYTKVAEPTGTTYTPTLGPARSLDLQVVRDTVSRLRRDHDVQHPHASACTCPTVEQVADGVNIVNGAPRSQQGRHDPAVRGLAPAGRRPGSPTSWAG